MRAPPPSAISSISPTSCPISSQITGSESFECAVRALRDAFKRCGDPRAFRRGDPQPLCVSPGAASVDALPHVADEEQKKALEVLRRTEARTKLVKWLVEEAMEIAAAAKKITWPPSARYYVAGHGVCGGLMSGPGGTRVFFQNRDISGVMRKVNVALGRWADEHAPLGFGWASLQMNVNTSSEWHYDHKNEGPSLLLVVGDHLGGEFECQGMQPTKFDGEVALIEVSSGIATMRLGRAI